MEKKGWVYWRHKKPKKSGAGNALQSLNALMTPGAKYALEISQKNDAKERDEQGDGHKPFNM